MDSPSSSANIAYYAGMVLDASAKRKLIYAGAKLMEMGQQDSQADALLEQAESLVYKLRQQRFQSTAEGINTILAREIDQIEEDCSRGGKMAGYSTGFSDLDYLTSGFSGGQLIILGACPGMGKTTFALQIALQVAVREKLPVVVISLEMSKGQLVRRLVCSEARVDANRIRNSTLTQEDWNRIADVSNSLAAAPLVIDDNSSMSVTDIASLCRRVASQHKGKLGLVMVDYLGLIRSTERFENQALAIGEITKALKRLSKDFNVPVLCLSQLSRELAKRPNKRPMLSDLRDSGAIEAEADVVMFLYRDSYFNTEKAPSVPGEIEVAECIIAKQRAGRVGTAELGFFAEQTRFVDIEKNHTGSYSASNHGDYDE